MRKKQPLPKDSVPKKKPEHLKGSNSKFPMKIENIIIKVFFFFLRHYIPNGVFFVGTFTWIVYKKKVFLSI